MAEPKDLTIQQGKTFSLPVRWENGDLVVRKPITAISLAFGAPRLTVASHGLPAGWRTYVTRCQGMKQINAADIPPRDNDYHPATVIDATTIELNDIDPVDDNGKEWPAYSDSGFLNWNAPVDLTGYTARMKIKDKVGGTVLASTDVLDAPKSVLTIAIDNALKTITLSIAATDTDDFTWKTGVYDLEMVSASGAVTAILAGKVSVTREVTT